MDFDTIKSQYNLMSYVESDLGPAQQGRTSATPKWCCPFHQEHTPSFVVYARENRWWCFGACNTGGDIIDYVSRRYSTDVKGAVERITGNSVSAPAPRAPMISKADLDKAPPAIETVMQYHQHREPVSKYIQMRGIDPRAVDDYTLGTQVDYRWAYNWQSEDYRGEAPVFVRGRRYTLPWFAGNEVRCINKRRDDGYAITQMMTMDQGLLAAVRADLASATGRVPDQLDEFDVIQAMYGPKYHKDGEGKIYNLNRLYQLRQDGSIDMTPNGPVVRRLSYVIVAEGEINALTAENYGFPAVAAKFKHGTNYAYPFSGVLRPLIVADNDEAGISYASQMLKAIGKGSVILLPDGVNDLNDLGADAPGWLLKAANVRPTLPALAAS